MSEVGQPAPRQSASRSGLTRLTDGYGQELVIVAALIVLFVGVNLLAVAGVYMTSETKDRSFGSMSSADADEIADMPIVPAPAASAAHL